MGNANTLVAYCLLLVAVILLVHDARSELTLARIRERVKVHVGSWHA